MNYTIIGTCSLCGGAVGVPTVWWGITPPIPSCQTCGAIVKQNHGPVLPMEHPRVINTDKTDGELY